MVLEILISGLCAFVRESCALTEAKGMHVLMLNDTAHDPRLVVDARFVELLAPADDRAMYSPNETIDLADGSQLFVWNLRGYRLDFEGSPKIEVREGSRTLDNVTNEYTKKKPDYGSGAVQNTPNDFSWVPEIHRACGVSPEKAKADPRAMDESMPPGYVAARLERLEVAKTGSGAGSFLDASVDDVWKDRVFMFGELDYQQVLADRVRLSLKFGSSPTTLELYSYAQGKVEKKIVLRPPPLQDTARVSVSNLPALRSTYKAGDELHHFMALYDLLEPNADQKCGVPEEGTGSSSIPVKCAFGCLCGEP